jgi:hypothetical protein
MRVARDFLQSKVTVTAILAIIGTLVAAYQKQITWQVAWELIFAAVQSMWIRDTVAKNGENATGSAPNERRP